MNHETVNQLLTLAGVFLGGGVGVALVAQGLKKVAGLNSAGVIHFGVVALSIVAAGAQYVLSLKNLPPQVLGISAPAIYGFSQVAYNFTKHATGFLSEVKAASDAKKASAAPTDTPAPATPPPAAF